MAFAVVWAVLLVTQPPHVKPTVTVAITTATQNQNTKVFVGLDWVHRCPRLPMSPLLARLGRAGRDGSGAPPSRNPNAVLQTPRLSDGLSRLAWAATRCKFR